MRSDTMIRCHHTPSTYRTVDDTSLKSLTINDLLLNLIMVSTIYVQLGAEYMLSTNTRFAMCVTDKGLFSTNGKFFIDIHVIKTIVMTHEVVSRTQVPHPYNPPCRRSA